MKPRPSQRANAETRATPIATPSGHHHDHHPTGLLRWVTTTHHKDIGTLYLWFSFTMFIVGGVLALMIRAELFQPGLHARRVMLLLRAFVGVPLGFAHDLNDLAGGQLLYGGGAAVCASLTDALELRHAVRRDGGR